MPYAPTEFVSCDWGLSNFRLCRVRTDTLDVLDRRSTSMGVKRLHRKLDSSKHNRHDLFMGYLRSQLDELVGPGATDEVVIVASGMVSSSLGLRELPYSPMPLHSGGKGLVTERIDAGSRLSVVLVSGAMDGDNLMRGEEVQAIGLAESLPAAGRSTLILPGTHSKHVTFEKGRFTGFKTYFTGELFELLRSESILRNSVSAAPSPEFCRDAFVEGVHAGASDGLNASLFSVRARDLLGQTKPVENYHFLSGLVIGSELGQLKGAEHPVVLAASESLQRPYQAALESLLSVDQFHCLPRGALENALLQGHRKILLS